MQKEIEDFLAKVTPAKRRRDAETLLDLMTRATGEQPQLSGSAIGFGHYHYKYPSGREGDAAPVGFAPRKPAMVVYLMDGVSAHGARLEQLGPHTASVGCLYIKDLEAIDLSILEEIITQSYRTLTKDTYRLRARDGRPAED